MDRRGFLTPLTELQATENMCVEPVKDSAHLPESVHHRRFRYPHTFSYKAG